MARWSAARASPSWAVEGAGAILAAGLFFLYGAAAGFLIVRLRRRRLPPRGPIRAVAWVTMAASLALAAMLAGWAVWAELG